MSWSLALQYGDLTVTQGGLGKTVGEAKLIQDLRCMFLTQQGSNPLHPAYGSLINGGIDSFGNWQRGVIGETDPTRIQFVFEQEVRRVCSVLQNEQLARAKADSIQYGKATLTPNEVLVSSSVEQFDIQGDTLSAVIRLETAANTSPILNLHLDLL